MARDELDRQIIDLLAEDGRISNVEAARHLGVSEATVRKRVGRLLASGDVRVVAVQQGVHQSSLLVFHVRARLTGGARAAAVDQLIRRPGIQRVTLTTGERPLVIRCAFSANDEVVGLIDELEAMPGVFDLITEVVLESHAAASTRPDPDGQTAPHLSKPTPHLNGLLDDAMTMVGGLAPDRVALHFIENGVPVYAASRNLSPEYLLDSTRAAYLECGPAPVTQAANTGNVIAIEDALAAADMVHMRDAVAREGFRSLVAVPVLSSGSPVAVVTLYSDEVRRWTSDDLKGTTRMADRLRGTIDAYLAALGTSPSRAVV